LPGKGKMATASAKSTTPTSKVLKIKRMNPNIA